MSVFSKIGALSPGRSVFNLSYEKKLTCDMGQLIPIMCDEVVPGDKFQIGNDIVIRFQPLVAPIMHEINVYVHYFFVPNRILWDDWEDFISGGVDGNYAGTPPIWDPTGMNTVGSLWDYFGFPTGVVPTGAFPLDFPRRAYNRVYNEFYRDENLQTEVLETNGTILNRAWEKDYFTSSLPWQQRGIAPALPISGTTSVIFNSTEWPAYLPIKFDREAVNVTGVRAGTASIQPQTSGVTTGKTAALEAYADIRSKLNSNTVDFSDATTFNVADLRLAFQIQKWMERNARGGVRYTEFLRSHFGVAPRDDRLQRPEYIGGSKSPCIISEVLQTSSTDATSAQGNLAGHGIAVDRTFAASYTAQEYGLIIGIMSVMPRSAYQQGIDRQWLRRNRYDYYFPEFANLSEQAIERAELYASNVEAENKTIFGYQGRFDEMRVKRNMVCGYMRDTFDYWHLGRKFVSAPGLNSEFIKCVPSKRIFAVQNEPGLIVNVGNRIKAIRPLPIQSQPGLIDHN